MLADDVGRLVRRFLENRASLAEQMRSAARSVHANVAEGSGRDTKREFARFLDPARAPILKDEHDPHRGVGGAEAGGVTAIERVLGIRRHHCRCKDLQQREQAMQYIVGVEAGRIHRVPQPRPPDEHEHEHIAAQAPEIVLHHQRRPNLRDGRYEDQIEK